MTRNRARCVSFRNGFAQAIDLDDQLHLVVHFLGPIRDVEWMLVAEDCALGFEKNHRLRRHLVAEFTGVVGIVSADADDFHGIADESVVHKERHLHPSVQSATI